MTVGDLGEFGLIAAITAQLPRGGRTVVGVGDDAAVLAAPDGRVVATMDLLVEARHFRRDWSAPADIGGKAAARNLADVAAMGATVVAPLGERPWGVREIELDDGDGNRVRLAG